MNGDGHDVLFDGSHPPQSDYRTYRQSVHARLVQILRHNPGCRFIEIGVGPTFRQERFRAVNELGIRYVGLDFEHVCPNAGPTSPRPASPIVTSPFWEMHQEHTCST